MQLFRAAQLLSLSSSNLWPFKLNMDTPVTPSVCLFVRLFVRHTGGSVKNGTNQDRQVFIVGFLEDSSFRNRKAFP